MWLHANRWQQQVAQEEAEENRKRRLKLVETDTDSVASSICELP